MTDSALQKAIDLAGGQTALGRAIGRRQSTIRTWLTRDGCRVPAEAAVDIEKALEGQVTRAELRPDLFAETDCDSSDAA